jgi:hypothetical protein
MATLKEDSDSWAAGGVKRRDFRHSHDGPEEIPIRGKRSKGRKPKAKGCPARVGEEKKAHIYVWVEYHGVDWYHKMIDDEWRFGYYRIVWYNYECVGCGHVNNRRFWWSPPPEQVYSVVRDAGEFRWKLN